MRDLQTMIEALLNKREIKKAEILIARQLRMTITDHQQAQLLVYRARTRLLSARAEGALDDLIRVRTLQPDALESPQNLELLADSYFARFELSTVGFADRNDAHQAQLLYQRLIDEYPNYSNMGWVYYQLGRVLLTDNQIDMAIECFQQALLNPSHNPALTAYCYERLGFVAFYEQRAVHRSLTFLNKAVDTFPIGEDRMWLIQIYILRSRVLREMHQLDLAFAEAEKALTLAASGRTERRSGLAEALLTAGELLSALEGREKDLIGYLEQFLQVSRRPLGVDVTWSRVYEMLGDAYFKVGRYDDAIIAYNAVVQFNPYHPWEVSVYHRIAYAYYQLNNFGKSVEAVQRALDIAHYDGHDPDYRLFDVFGNAHFALGRYDKAAEAYATALQLAPTHLDDLDKIRRYHQVSLEMLRQA